MQCACVAETNDLMLTLEAPVDTEKSMQTSVNSIVAFLRQLGCLPSAQTLVLTLLSTHQQLPAAVGQTGPAQAVSSFSPMHHPSAETPIAALPVEGCTMTSCAEQVRQQGESWRLCTATEGLHTPTWRPRQRQLSASPPPQEPPSKQDARRPPDATVMRAHSAHLRLTVPEVPHLSCGLVSPGMPAPPMACTQPPQDCQSMPLEATRQQQHLQQQQQQQQQQVQSAPAQPAHPQRGSSRRSQSLPACMARSDGSPKHSSMPLLRSQDAVTQLQPRSIQHQAHAALQMAMSAQGIAQTQQMSPRMCRPRGHAPGMIAHQIQMLQHALQPQQLDCSQALVQSWPPPAPRTDVPRSAGMQAQTLAPGTALLPGPPQHLNQHPACHPRCPPLLAKSLGATQITGPAQAPLCHQVPQHQAAGVAARASGDAAGMSQPLAAIAPAGTGRTQAHAACSSQTPLARRCGMQQAIGCMGAPAHPQSHSLQGCKQLHRSTSQARLCRSTPRHRQLQVCQQVHNQHQAQSSNSSAHIARTSPGQSCLVQGKHQTGPACQSKLTSNALCKQADLSNLQEEARQTQQQQQQQHLLQGPSLQSLSYPAPTCLPQQHLEGSSSSHAAPQAQVACTAAQPACRQRQQPLQCSIASAAAPPPPVNSVQASAHGNEKQKPADHLQVSQQSADCCSPCQSFRACPLPGLPHRQAGSQQQQHQHALPSVQDPERAQTRAEPALPATSSLRQVSQLETTQTAHLHPVQMTLEWASATQSSRCNHEEQHRPPSAQAMATAAAAQRVPALQAMPDHSPRSQHSKRSCHHHSSSHQASDAEQAGGMSGCAKATCTAVLAPLFSSDAQVATMHVAPSLCNHDTAMCAALAPFAREHAVDIWGLASGGAAVSGMATSLAEGGIECPAPYMYQSAGRHVPSLRVERHK